MTFAAPLSPLTARRPRVGLSATTATTIDPKQPGITKRPCTMVVSDGIKRRLRTGFGALTAAIALSLTRVPGAITPDSSPSHPPVALATAFNTSTKSTSFATVLVARQSLQDLCDEQQSSKTTEQANSITSIGTSSINEMMSNEDGEFALSVRLCTACALGVLMGSEMGAAALALGMRALVVISLTSCLATIYALLPPGTDTTFLVQVVPPFVAPFVASAVALVGLLLFSMLQPRITRRRLRRQRLTRSAKTSGVVASAAGAGAACAAGQALPAVMFYLIALAICRSAPLPRSRRRRLSRGVGQRSAFARELATVSTQHGNTPEVHTTFTTNSK